ncbi:RidA family protein [Altericroceibacterium endophyticum]|uniref:RidA family protein n=1 Tax=Altericroceibacterium endophyticum TaxID=1808508 RepID=A0A6I4TAX5_9SPHN|nr:RidA family protein [Altericroceibacterium endophyticum]MXO67020.1 RidA family protein [Altericroceibacterium endophyticum]
MSDRRSIPPQSPFEESAGFTRGLRLGNRIEIAGTIGTNQDGSVSPDAGAQADRCFELITSYVEELGGSRNDIVRVRMFVTNMADADAVTASFSRALKDVRPTATLVAIAGLYDPAWKVEIEAEAQLGENA